MLLSERLQFRATSHRSVIIHNLTNHCRRLKTRETRKITPRFRMTSSHQYTAGPCLNWEDMTRLHQVSRFRVCCNRCLNGPCAIGGTDTRGYTLCCLNTHGKSCFVSLSILDHHRWEPELSTTCFSQGQTNQATRVPCHEVDMFWRAMRTSKHKIALVFAILVIHQDNHLSSTNIRN